MKKLIIDGKVANSNGCVTTITIAGQSYSHQEIKEGNFNIPLLVNSGQFSLYIHGKTDGILTVTITGDITSIDPSVPINLASNFSKLFDVTLNELE